MNRHRNEKTTPVLSLETESGGWVAMLGGRRLYKGTRKSLAKSLILQQWEQKSRFSQELGWGQFDRSQISFPGTGSWVFTCDVGLWVHQQPGVTELAVKLRTVPFRVFVLCGRHRQQLKFGVHIYSWLSTEAKPIHHIYIMQVWAQGFRSGLGLQYQFFSLHAWF